jgi:small subunit ribosomal protein S16
MFSGGIVSLKIRLKRMGSSKKPYFRVIVVDERMSGKGRRVEDLGTYNPKNAANSIVNFKKEALEGWVKKGAVMTPTVAGLLKKSAVKV